MSTYRGGDQFNIGSINGDSSSLNTQKQLGGEKPKWSGNSNPGNCKPERAPTGPVTMPK